jgi:uncharacterized Zn finger protein (UPF0148 family)
MGNSGWEAPIKAAIKYNAEHANDQDGYCPECAWTLDAKDGKKHCPFCGWIER